MLPTPVWSPEARIRSTVEQSATHASSRKVEAAAVTNQSPPWPKQGPRFIPPVDRDELRPVDCRLAEGHRRLRSREAHGDREPPRVRVRDGAWTCQRARRLDVGGKHGSTLGQFALNE